MSTEQDPQITAEDEARAHTLVEAYNKIKEQMAKGIVGQEEVIEQLLIAVLARGHCLLEGVPGLAKTLMVRTLADAMDLTFHRIQFTPDLMPADITGTDIIQQDKETGHRELIFEKGPIFSQMLLAAEINRTPEGTYPLPEAQRDRFLFHVTVDYPSRDEERDIVTRTTSTFEERLEPVIDGQTIIECQETVRRVPVPDHVIEFVLDLVRMARPDDPGAVSWARELISWGPGPRACQQVVLGAKVRAVLKGRYHVTVDDIEALAYPVLRHRIVPTFNAEAEGITVNHIIEKLLEDVPKAEAQVL